MAVFNYGDLVRLSASFTMSGSLTNPTAVFMEYRKPSGTTASFAHGSASELGNPSTGVYEILLDIDEPGTWYYRFWSTGCGQGAAQAHLRIAKSYI